MNCKYRKERNYIQNKLPELEKKLKQFGYSNDDIKNLKNDRTEEIDITKHDTVSKYLHWIRLMKHKREKAKESKEKLSFHSSVAEFDNAI